MFYNILCIEILKIGLVLVHYHTFNNLRFCIKILKIGLVLVPVILIIVFAIRFNLVKNNSKKQKKYNKYMKFCIKTLIVCYIINIILNMINTPHWTIETYSLMIVLYYMPCISFILIILSFVMFLINRNNNSENVNEYKKIIKMLLITSLIFMGLSIVYNYLMWYAALASA